MSVQVSDVRCVKCGRKVAEAVRLTSGELVIQCPRCKHRNVIAVETATPAPDVRPSGA